MLLGGLELIDELVRAMGPWISIAVMAILVLILAKEPKQKRKEE